MNKLILNKRIFNRLLVALALLANTPAMAASTSGMGANTSGTTAPFCSVMSLDKTQLIQGEVDKYLLPNNQTRAIRTVHTEGTLPGQGIFDISLEAKKDWSLMRNLALLWQQQHRPEDLAALSNLLRTWGTTYVPSFNPIDETQLDNYIQAYVLTRGALSDDVRSIAQAFIQKLGQGYLDRMEAIKLNPNDASVWSNNWNSHRVKLVTLAALALDDQTMWGRAKTQYFKQLGRNLRADGSTLDFWQRNALQSAVNGLESLTRAALAARLRNEDWLKIKGSTGASLSDALDWLLPYAQGLKTNNNEYLGSKVAFDANRNNALGLTYKPWDPKQSSDLYAMAAVLSADKYKEISQQLKPLQPTASRLLLESFASLITLRRAVQRELLPNNQNRAIQIVHTEGLLSSDPTFIASWNAKKDWPLMRNLALLWQLQRRPEDLAALSNLLTAWGTTYQPSFNPIDETPLDTYIVAYSITRDALPDDARSIAQAFIQKLGAGYLDRMEAIKLNPNDASTWSNNWNSQRVKLVTLAALALDDKAMWARAKTQFVNQLGRNLNRAGINNANLSNDGSSVNFYGTTFNFQGSTVDFWQRDAMHYVVYDLEPLAQAALAARLRNEDWLTIKGSTGASLSDALDWLVPYALGNIKRENEFLHSSVQFDFIRSHAGMKGYSGPWDPTESSDLYAIANLLDIKYAGVSQKLNPSSWTKACWRAY